MEVPALTIFCHEGHPPADDIFVYDGCPQPVPARSPRPGPGSAEEARAPASAGRAARGRDRGGHGGVEDTIGGIDLGRGMMIRGPDFANMDASADKFVLTALEQARGTRVRREDHTEALQQASVELLRAVTELRTGVANTHEYRGDRMGMAAQLAAIRTRAADSQVHALNVALLAPESLAQPAQDLARAANRLAEGATRETDLDRGIMARRPDFSEISALGDAFALAAVEQAGSSHARRDDHAVALQQASVDLLRAVTELRTAQRIFTITAAINVTRWLSSWQVYGTWRQIARYTQQRYLSLPPEH